MKWQKWISQENLAMLTLIVTLGFSIPSAVALAKNPTIKFFKIVLFNIAMSFFFFSYHVHEKTILIPLLPLLINIRFFRHFYRDFIAFSTITCYVLLREDKLDLQFFVLIIFYLIFGGQLISFLESFWSSSSSKQRSILLVGENKIDNFLDFWVKFYKKYVSKLLYFAVVVGMIVERLVTPPQKLQYLYALTGFIEFGWVFVYSNLKLFSLIKKENFKFQQLGKNLKKELSGKQE